MEWKKCKKCGMLQHPTHLRCLKCKNQQFSLIKAEGSAKLLTYTILNAPPKEFRDAESYALGVIQFENGIKGLGQLEIEGPIKLGMLLEPFKKKICDSLDGKEIIDYVFRTTK